jgi:hypothetical protein
MIAPLEWRAPSNDPSVAAEALTLADLLARA